MRIYAPSKKIYFFLLILIYFLAGSACGSDDGSSNLNSTDAVDARDESDAEEFDVADPDAEDADAAIADELPPRPWSVSEPGPYRIGYTESQVIYDARGSDTPRKLRLALWYPTLDAEGEVSRYWRRIDRPQAFMDASVAIDPAQPAPLLVFSHGNAAMAEQSYFMAEFFASHGWVVVSPDHVGNTFLDTAGAIDLTSAVFRSQDITAVLDHMLDLGATDPLHGLISPENIILSGHSFGGFTTLSSSGATFAIDELAASCAVTQEMFCEILDGHDEWIEIFEQGFYDPRIKVAIPQAPGGYLAFQSGLADIEMPTLLITGRMDRTLPPDEEGDPIWAHMRGSEHLRLDILKAGHFTFSNMCEILGDGIEMLRNDGCGPEFVEVYLGYEIINAYALAFARAHLFGDTSADALLSGEDTRYAESIELMRLEEP